jgi:hypothetical protein
VHDQVQRSEYEGKESGDDNDEPASELEIVQQEEHDDDPTPKKKEKVAKVPVREAVGANRREPEARRELGKVSTYESDQRERNKDKTLFCLLRFVMSRILPRVFHLSSGCH